MLVTMMAFKNNMPRFNPKVGLANIKSSDIWRFEAQREFDYKIKFGWSTDRFFSKGRRSVPISTWDWEVGKFEPDRNALPVKLHGQWYVEQIEIDVGLFWSLVFPISFWVWLCIVLSSCFPVCVFKFVLIRGSLFFLKKWHCQCIALLSFKPFEIKSTPHHHDDNAIARHSLNLQHRQKLVHH